MQFIQTYDGIQTLLDLSSVNQAYEMALVVFNGNPDSVKIEMRTYKNGQWSVIVRGKNKNIYEIKTV
jgi:hypothetical protein